MLIITNCFISFLFDCIVAASATMQSVESNQVTLIRYLRLGNSCYGDKVLLEFSAAKSVNDEIRYESILALLVRHPSRSARVNLLSHLPGSYVATNAWCEAMITNNDDLWLDIVFLCSAWIFREKSEIILQALANCRSDSGFRCVVILPILLSSDIRLLRHLIGVMATTKSFYLFDWIIALFLSNHSDDIVCINSSYFVFYKLKQPTRASQILITVLNNTGDPDIEYLALVAMNSLPSEKLHPSALKCIKSKWNSLNPDVSFQAWQLLNKLNK